MPHTRSADVAVVGAGMAGLVAAARATERGARVTVLEKAPRAGGSMYLSNGALYTDDSLEAAKARVPGGDPALQRLVVESFDDAKDWLEAQGVGMTDRLGDFPFGSGQMIDPAQLTECLVERVEAGGGTLYLETPMRSLRARDGRVTGVRARGPDGDDRVVEAESTVIATGGFQGNEELVERYITPNSEAVWLRSNPWSTGDGLLAAQDAGAKTTGGLDTFYGHALPTPPAEFSTLEFVEATQYYGPMGVALDRSGRRFTDEAESIFEHTLAQDIAAHTDGRAYYVIDDDVYTDTWVTGSPVEDMVEAARDFGGRVADADSIPGICGALGGWGVDARRAERTIESFNDAITAGEADALYPARSAERNPLDTPPYHAVEVQAGITFTAGGLDVDTECRVLRRSGTSSTLRQHPAEPRDAIVEPLAGLYAAGSDLGGVHHRGYLGGLATALVTGWTAGRAAADAAS